LFFGFMLVRPINFAFGAYLSGSIALLLLKALVKTHATCTIIFWIPVLVAMVFGSLAAWKRGSIFGLLGLIAGEVAGRYFYNILLRPFAAPEQLAYTCIGFFAVVMVVFLEFIGDVVVSLVCACLGAFTVTRDFTQLLVIPFLDHWSSDRLTAFVNFQYPDVTRLGHGNYNAEYWGYIRNDPFIFYPFCFTAALALYGAIEQHRLLHKHGHNRKPRRAKLTAEAAPAPPPTTKSQTTRKSTRISTKKATPSQRKSAALSMQ